MKLSQILVNKRSKYVHTKNCESVKQMKNSNVHLERVVRPEQLQGLKMCGHCMKKVDFKEFYREDFRRRKALIEKRRQRDIERVNKKYDDKIVELRDDYHEKIESLDSQDDLTKK